MNASRSARAASRSSATLGSLSANASIFRSYYAATDSLPGCSNTEGNRVRTHGHDAFGVIAIKLVVHWVRQRCQAAPGGVAPIAATRPAWASEVTSRTPEIPRPVSEPRR